MRDQTTPPPTTPGPAPGQPDPEHDTFPDMLAAVHRRFAARPVGPLLLTSPVGLWAAYLDALPPEQRQHYNCHACRRFVEHFGAAVTVDDAGHRVSAMWDATLAPAGYERLYATLAEQVESAPVADVLLSSERVLGTPVTSGKNWGDREWTHFSVTLPAAAVHRHSLLTAGQARAEKREDVKGITRALAEFPLALAEQSHAMLTSGALYRSEKCVAVATWFRVLHRALAAVGLGDSRDQRRDALVWRAAATAPPGFAHVRSSMIGTLLEDLAAGLDGAAIKRRFDEKMAPANYQRATAAPAAGNVAQAERVVSQLASSGALARRYARLDDVRSWVWRPAATEAPTPGTGKSSNNGVFAHVVAKPRRPTPADTAGVEIPGVQTVTWAKFARDVLPGATKVEARVPDAADRFAALVTAVDPDAPPVLQWDGTRGAATGAPTSDPAVPDGARNPVSWYYHGGIDAEMRRRVEEAGGKYDDVDIRASLLWDNRNDLDLHAVTPKGEHVYFGERRSRCGGELDVDRNIGGETTTPVENIRWPKGRALAGRYRFYVRNFRFWEHDRRPTPFRVELEVNGDVLHFESTISPRGETSAASDVTVCDFRYEPGKAPAMLATSLPQIDRSRGTAGTRWNLAPGSWATVTGVTTSPNLWGERPQPQHGRHVFFLLAGCRDDAPERGRGLFVETLRGEYRPVRATLEAHLRGSTIAGADDAEACGLGMTDQKPWDLTVRVATATSTATYLIDRWE